MKTGTLRPLKLAIIWSSALVASEWLFFATMPSFMSRLDWTDKLLTLAAASAIFVFLVVIALVLAGMILKVFGTTGARAYRYLSAAVASALLTILLVLLVDNFTYTLFEFGLRSIRSLASAILYILLIIWLYLRIFRWTIVQTSMAADEAPPYRKWKIAIQLLAVITAGVLWAPWSDDKPAAGGNLQSRPNILIVGGDALEAFHMSVYGYQRNTTPFLANKRDEFLVSANSFTNNAVTLGSNIALLTGKYPAGTGVIYPPNILTGRDQFEHLPGLLRSMGYRTADMSVRWTADPGDAGMRCGFEFANFRKLDECVGDAGAMQRLYAGLSVSIVLLEQISDRIVERLTILNPLTGTEYSAGGAIRAGQPDSYWLKDDARVREAIRFMNSFSGNPFFIHIHFLGTHGPHYEVRKQVHSAGKSQTVGFDDDFYDDAIVDFDRNIQILYEALDAAGELESTIFVVTSDHGRKWSLSERLPLMIRFPHSRHAGLFKANSQRLDVAPTLLDYLGEAPPGWMVGHSLINRDVQQKRMRTIVQTGPSRIGPTGSGRFELANISPPFYSIGTLQLIVCQALFTWNLDANSWRSGEVRNYETPCRDAEIPTPSEWIATGRRHLLEYGYDVSTLASPAQEQSGEPAFSPNPNNE